MSGWKQRDPLYRGDASVITPPDPTADDSIVRHVLYLDGYGRATPYLSTSEARSVAAQFAGKYGQIWLTDVPRVHAHGVAHISRKELLALLKGKGKGRGSWTNAFEVMRARQYVEQWHEHLLDFSGVENDLIETIDAVFDKD